MLPIDRAENLPPLHAAARTGDVTAVTALLDAGAAPDEIATVTRRQRTHTGLNGALYTLSWTPLHTAAEQGQVSVARMDLLLEHGANINAVNSEALSVLIYAAGGSRGTALRNPRPLPDVVRYLLQCGADPTLKDGEGKTAHDAAQAGLEKAPVNSADSLGFQEVLSLLKSEL